MEAIVIAIRVVDDVLLAIGHCLGGARRYLVVARDNEES